MATSWYQGNLQKQLSDEAGRKLQYPMLASNNNEFARDTLQRRVPSIVQNVANHLKAQGYSQEVVSKVERIKQRLIDNASFGTPDGALDAPWLHTECRVYEELHEIVPDYDYFGAEKAKSLEAALKQFQGLPGSFEEAILGSLWGNKVDLSMLISTDNVSAEHLQAADEHLLINELPLAKHVLDSNPSCSVVIVLDNAGSELLADLQLTEHLLRNNLASAVTLHCKPFPWFVSDATPSDIEYTMAQLSQGMPTKQLHESLQSYVECKRLSITTHPFWCTTHVYDSMQTEASDLYAQLNAASLVLFKGDLSYRKFIADVFTNPHLDKDQVLTFSPAPCLLLRTLKSDGIVGVPSSVDVSSLEEAWRNNGKYGIIQFVHRIGQ